MLDSGLLHRAGGGLRYRHALLAEAARADLRDPEGTHLAVALAVEAAAAPADARAAEVAHHLRRAGRDDLAAPRWRQAARHARTLGALPEATAFWAEAVRCDPDDAATRLELVEVHAWSGRTEEFEREWAAALACLTPDAAAAAWRRRGLLLKTVVCNPAASLSAYRRAAELLGPDAPTALRARVLVGLAWNEGATGDPVQADTLLAEVRELVAPGGVPAGVADELVAETESARLITLIRLGRFAECEAVAEAAGAAADRLRRPDLAYVIWIQTTCALTCAGDHEGALRTAERGIAATRDVAVVTLPCLAARAHLLARLGRHGEAAEVVAELLATAGRLDSPPLLALARHDAGLVALADGRHGEAADLLRAALDGDAAVSRPAARLAAAEAMACAGSRGRGRRRAPPRRPRARRARGPAVGARAADGPRARLGGAGPWRRCRGPAAAHRGGGGLAAPRGAGWRGRRRSTWRRWSTSAARPSSGWSSPTGSSPGSWASWRSWRSDAGIHADGPGRRRRSRTCGSCCSTRRGSRSGGWASRPCGSTPRTSTRCGPTACRTSRCRRSCARTG